MYNTAQYIEKTLDCVTRQTYENLEIIICDNASTDRSFELAASFAAKDKRIRLYKNQRNLGYAGNFHKVTSLAMGDFMLLQCADDYPALHMIERFVSMTHNTQIDPQHTVYLADAYIVDQQDQIQKVSSVHAQYFYNNVYDKKDYIATGQIRQSSGFLALRDAVPLLKSIGFFGAVFYSKALFNRVEGVYSTKIFGPDADFMYTLLMTNPQVMWLNEPLTYWRFHDANHIAQENKDMSLKPIHDAYSYVFGYPDDFFKLCGTTRTQVAARFVDYFCLRKSISLLKENKTLSAFRVLCYALATYPHLTIKNPKFYAVIAGCLGGRFAASFMKSIYQSTSIFKDKTFSAIPRTEDPLVLNPDLEKPQPLAPQSAVIVPLSRPNKRKFA